MDIVMRSDPHTGTERQLISPSSRISNVEEYYFSRKLKQIGEMRKEGKEIINLGIGSPDMTPSEETVQTLYFNALDPSNHGYQSYTGIPELRNAFAGWYSKYFGVELNPGNEILPLVGSKEGVMHISLAFIDQGDEVLVPDPGYPAYAATARLAGGVVRYYNLTEENGWYPDTDALEKEGVEKVKIMWINYPHMPTGKKATPDLFKKLIAFATKHNILLCNDNPYSFILNDDYLSILSLPGAMETALELNSLSKSHNMAGWRIGMVAGNAAYISAILRVKSNMDSGMFQPLQAAAVSALGSSPEWYDELNRVYRKRRVNAEKIMQLLSCSCDHSQSGMFLWGKVPDEALSAEDISEKLLHEAGVFITPGFIFGNNGTRYLRISLCADEETLAQAHRKIELYLQKNQSL